MIKFEKKYLYTFADVEEAKKLIGKKGIFFDNYIDDDELRKKPMETLQKILPFYVTLGGFIFKSEQGENYHFFYHDPYMEFKRAYYLEGKKIQTKNIYNEWIDCPCEPSWLDVNEYRIKPEETRLTNREVAEWLAKGNGQVDIDGTRYTDFYYDSDYDDTDECEYLIRKWSDDDWHEATREYIEDEE